MKTACQTGDSYDWCSQARQAGKVHQVVPASPDSSGMSDQLEQLVLEVQKDLPDLRPNAVKEAS